MPLSIFSVSDVGLLGEILSYETSENLYKYTLRVNIQWQKAAIIELLLRRATSTDIFYQEKLFKENFNQRLRQDADFIKTLSVQILLSMASPFSTPNHKLQASFFLCHFNEIPDGFIPDNAITSFSAVSSGRFYYNNRDRCFYNDKHHNASVLASILPQTQIDRVISNMILKLNDNCTDEIASHTQFILAPRTKLDQIETFITSVIQRLDDNRENRDELRTLRVFASKLNSEQLDTIITKMLAKLNELSFCKSYILNHLMTFASSVTPTQAYRVFTQLTPSLTTSNSVFRTQLNTIKAFASRLGKDRIKTLNPADILLLLPDRDAMYSVLIILAPGLTSDQSYTIYLDLFPKVVTNYSSRDAILTILNILALGLEDNQAQEIISNLLSKVTTKIGVRYQSKPERPTIWIEPDDIDTEIHSIEDYHYNGEVLDALIPLRQHLTKEQVSTIFETMMLILNSKATCQYYTALRTITALVPQLDQLQRGTMYTSLYSILDNNNATQKHHDVLETLIVLVPHLTEPQVNTIFSKIISILNKKRYRSDSTHELADRMACDMLVALLLKLSEPQITIICNTIQTLLDITKIEVQYDLRNRLLNTVTALIPRLSEIQIDKLFTVALQVKNYNCDALTRLKTLAALIDKLTLTQPQVNSLVSGVLKDESYSKQKPDFYNIIFHITIKFASRFDSEQILRVFSQIMGTMGNNPELNYETSPEFLATSNVATTLALKLTQPQVDTLLAETIPMLNNDPDIYIRDRLIILAIFSALVSRLDKKQIDIALTHIISEMHAYSIPSNDNDSGELRIICRVALNVLAAFVPRLEEEQVKVICTNISLLASIEWDEIRHSALMLINTLMMANKLDFSTLQQELIANNASATPFVLEAITTLDIMKKIRTDVAQHQNNISVFAASGMTL